MSFTNTKVLFSTLMKARAADCICDIGSCDGSHSLLFRDLRPQAAVLAFEANPINFRTMQAREALRAARVDVFGFALSNNRGTATFHVSDVDYSDPSQNLGTSSFFVREGVKIKESIEVKTRRIDDFILEKLPHARRIGLWMDVEGAEYLALEGMEKIAERVVAVHVESARVPMRPGQRTLDELLPLMERLGFDFCGSNITPDRTWGDVVFVNRAVAREMGWRLGLCRLRARVSYGLKADQMAVFLKSCCPPLYRLLRRVYVRCGT